MEDSTLLAASLARSEEEKLDCRSRGEKAELDVCTERELEIEPPPPFLRKLEGERGREERHEDVEIGEPS